MPLLPREGLARSSDDFRIADIAEKIARTFKVTRVSRGFKRLSRLTLNPEQFQLPARCGEWAKAWGGFIKTPEKRIALSRATDIF